MLKSLLEPKLAIFLVSEGDDFENASVMGRLLRSFLPFLLSLVVVIAANVIYELYFLERWQVEDPANPTQPQSEISQTVPQHTLQPVPTAIANAVSTPEIEAATTPVVQPTMLPSDFANLNGPPAESRFALPATVTLYWQSSGPLAPGQRFQVHLYGEEEEVLLGIIEEPNLGQRFQISFSTEEIDLPDGRYQWQVQLFDEQFEAPISRSELRPITFLGG